MPPARECNSATMTGTLCILDSVSAAGAWVARGLAAASTPLSLDYAVVGFLRARGVECQDFSDSLRAEDASAALQIATTELEDILVGLDETVGARACAAAQLPRLALFHAAFKYLGQYQLAGLRTFEQLLSQRLAAGGEARVEFFNAAPEFADPVFDFIEAARRVCAQAGREFALQTVRQAPPTLGARVRRVLQLGGRVLGSPLRELRRWQARARRTRAAGLTSDAATLLLFAPLSESFFEGAFAKTGLRIVYIEDAGWIRGSESLRAAGMTAATRMRAVLEDWLAQQPDWAGNIAGRCVAQLARTAEWMLAPVWAAQQVLGRYPIVAAAWDAPLITRQPLNLVNEVLLVAGLRVLGRQHGANYIDQRLGTIHFDSDFNRCTHFFSYGAGPQEFALAYPGRRHRCEVIPAGNPALPFAGAPRRTDIAYPIANCVPLYYLCRIPESEHVRRQAAILAAMESRRDLRCEVKPPPGFSHRSFAHSEALAALEHVRVVEGRWTDYLAAMQPRLVIFEVASTPLTEVLPYDVDIFVMLDPLFPFTENALAMLARRAHVFASIEDLSNAIRRYGREPLARLRDSSYYDTYVNRGSAAAVTGLLTDYRAALRLNVAT
jgi:hypothetical protein